jgi:uncharacterized membrane protein
MFPPIPAWNALHPFAIHFPIALWVVAPLFALIDLLAMGKTRAFGLAALLVLALGTIGGFAAAASGGAGADLIGEDAPVALLKAVKQHGDLGETSRTVYAVLTALYAALILGYDWLGRRARFHYPKAARGVFVVVLVACLLLVINTGYLGGRLVHEFGVRAGFGDAPPSKTAQTIDTSNSAPAPPSSTE